MLTIVGIVVVFISIIVSTVMDGNSFAPLIGPSSLVLVGLGSIGAGMTGFEIPDMASLPKSMILAFTRKPSDSDSVVTTMMKMAEVARREGVLALEEKLKDIEDPFLKQGLQLVVDGMDTDNVRAILDTMIDGTDGRHQTQISIWKGLGGYAPTMGMLGTVIGLINMLGNLSDPSQLGVGMSLALLTTLYGVFFANVMFLPIAAKLESLNASEVKSMELIVDGVLAIQAGASPRMLVERLEAWLDPAQRVGHQARAKGGAEAA
jgi:chemotaxis protein MotA